MKAIGCGVVIFSAAILLYLSSAWGHTWLPRDFLVPIHWCFEEEDIRDVARLLSEGNSSGAHMYFLDPSTSCYVAAGRILGILTRPISNHIRIEGKVMRIWEFVLVFDSEKRAYIILGHNVGPNLDGGAASHKDSLGVRL